jgi:hypothetical protein
MPNTLVNKNLLIPEIETSDNLNNLIQKMSDITYNMNNTFCLNVYIVSEQGIYFNKNNKLYNSNELLIREIQNNNSLKENFNKIKSFMENELNKDELVFVNKEKINDETVIKMKLDINEKKTNNITIKEEPKKLPIKSKEEIELIKLIEETMELYQKEVQQRREIEKQIKILDDNTKSINKKNREKFLTNLSKLKNDYDTYTKIIKKQSIKPEFQIPELFLLKNNYFNNLLKNEKNKTILEQISELDLDQILNQEYELNDDINNLITDYGSESKKLNVKFDHSWEDLELETEPTEKNNSRLGSFH